MHYDVYCISTSDDITVHLNHVSKQYSLWNAAQCQHRKYAKWSIIYTYWQHQYTCHLRWHILLSRTTNVNEVKKLIKIVSGTWNTVLPL